MKTKTIVESNIDDLQFGWFDPETEKFHPLHHDEEEWKELAERKDFKVRLIEAILMLRDELEEGLSKDLKDIWGRLDRLEES